ncbi:MAG: alpha/beta hydrolase, partial [Eubacteriaceae bacterium]|nr:alpha/beta hydrolase [Eubacteriaceae bacterium]
MKKVMKTILVIIIVLITAAGSAFGVYWHHNMHWYDRYEKALETAGAEEKQALLPGGRVINYGEVENDNPALLLIHGQMSTWEDYALV